MPQLKYTASLRDQAGETNSATPLTDNLQDIEDLATTGFDVENIEPWSLDHEHIYDGGGAPAPLKAAYNDYDNGGTTYGGPSGTWEDIVEVTVTAESGVSGIYVWAGLRVDTLAATADSVEIRLMLENTTAITQTTRDIGTDSRQNGGGHTIYAFRASAGTHIITLQLSVTTAAALPDWHDAFVTALVISR